MHFDALTLACVCAELNPVIGGGRVQQVLLPDDESIGLEIYAQRQRHYLLAVTSAQQARVHLTQQKLRRGAEQPTQLLLLLRKYVRDSLLTAVEQVSPTERSVHLHFVHGEHGPTRLVLELIGQRSNILLVNPAGRILECLRRVRPEDQTARKLLPGQPYTPPPPQNRLAPFDDGSPDYYAQLEALTQTDGKLWKILSSHLAGISPTLGREIAWRVTGDLEGESRGSDFLALVQALQELWAPVQSGAWEPGIWLAPPAGAETAAVRVAGFAPYTVHGRGEFIQVDTISTALEQFYGQAPAQGGINPGDSYAGLRTTVAAEVRRAQQRVQRQLAALAGDEPAPGAAEKLRSQAEWLLALQSQLQPGQAALLVDVGDEVLEIALDQEKTPVTQAEEMFKRAGRMERAAQIIPERRARLQAELAFLDQLQTDLGLAENQPEIAAVREELDKAGFSSVQKRKSKERVGAVASQPRRYYSPQGFEILVGRNARQNERVTFDLAQGADLWLHVRGVPGSHVVIRTGGQRVSAETLQMAAQLAAYFSAARGERAAVVSYTPRRFVSRATGGRPGQVQIRNEQTVTVVAELPEQ